MPEQLPAGKLFVLPSGSRANICVDCHYVTHCVVIEDAAGVHCMSCWSLADDRIAETHEWYAVQCMKHMLELAATFM